MIKVAYANIKSKNKINGRLSDHLILLSTLHAVYNIVAGVLSNLINSDKRIKGMETGDHEIKIVFK